MTRREFDAATKRNLGAGMARDEIADYRASRMREHRGSGAHVATVTRPGLIDRRASWNDVMARVQADIADIARERAGEGQ